MKKRIISLLMALALCLSLLPTMALAAAGDVNYTFYTDADGSNPSEVATGKHFKFTVTTANTEVSVAKNNDSISGACTIPASVSDGTNTYSVTSIGMGAFDGCSGLTSVDIPSSVTSIGIYAFNYCSGLTSVTFAEGSKCTSIGNSAFYDCSKLTSVTIPSGVTSIGDNAFYLCVGLTSVTFAEGSKCTSIGTNVFYYCNNLTSVTIPAGVTSIGGYAFSSCSGLTNVMVEATTPPALGTGAIPNDVKKIYVPAESIDAYKTAGGWSTYDDKIVGYSTSEHIHDGIVFEPWETNNALPADAGSYYLDEDVTLTETWTVPAGVTNLDLNGHVIKLADGKTGSVINVPNNATLNLYDCNTTTKHYFKVEESGLWTLLNAEADGCKTVTGGVITGGNDNTSGKGGGVYNNGTFTMYGGTIAGCTAAKLDTMCGGGGVYNNGTFTMNGGSIVGCTVVGSRGGGVFNDGTFMMNAGSIQECKAFSDSDQSKGIGGGVWNQQSFTLSGGSIQNNEVSHHGGGIGNAGEGSITISSGSINNNIAPGLGGGINSDGDVTISGGTIENNTAGNDGGGIRINGEGKTLKIIGGTISGNTTTTGTGGGVYYGKGTVTLGGNAKITGNFKGTTTNNLYLPTGKTISFESGANAPTEEMEVGVTLADNYSGSFTQGSLSNTVFAQLTSDDPTIAFELEGSNIKKSTTSAWAFLQQALNGTLSETNSVVEIKNNVVTLKSDIERKSDDAALVISADSVTLDLNGKVLKGTGEDSVIKIGETGNLTITDSNPTAEHYFTVDNATGLWTLTNNKTDDTETVKGGVITGGNSSGSGGGVYVYDGGTFIMFGGTIAGNKAKNGGGVLNGGSFTIENATICGNFATENGGGVFNTGTVAMSSGTIKNNEASADGGGVYIYNKTFTMDGGSIAGNVSGDDGGGVYVGGTFDMNGGTISGNTAVYGGGIVNNQKTIYLTAAVNKTITITGNTATKVAGGIANWGTLHLSDKVIIKENICTYKYNGTNYPVNLETSSPIIIGGALTDSEIYITHTNLNTDEHDTGVLTSGFTTKNPGAKLGDFFTYDGPNSFAMILNSNELEVVNAYAVTNDRPQASEAENHGYLSIDKTTAGTGEVVTVTVMPASGYQLKANTLKAVYDDGEEKTCVLTPGAGNTYTFAMPAYAVTVSAEFEQIPSSGGGSSTITVPVSGDENSVKISATVSGNTATVKPIADAELAKVADGESVAIDLSGVGKNVDTAKIPTETVEKISEKSALTVKLPVATVEFDKAATEEIADQAKGSNIELVVDSVKEVSLNAVQKEAVKKLDTAIIIDAHLASNGSKLCTAEGGGFGGGKAKVILPYEIKNNRTAANYSVYYVDETGKLEKLNAKYDTKLAAFVFEIEHFSVYAVAYDENAVCPKDATCPMAAFGDLNVSAWYHDGVHYCVANGYMKGVSTDKFAPSGTLSRAMIVTMLWRMEGEPVVNYAMSFKDVADGQWYTEAIRWAQSNKIVEGYSAESFDPDNDVNREQLAAILYRYAQSKGEGFTGSWMFLLDFVDRADISSWADEAVHWCSMNGIVTGKDGKVFDPQGKATRAEAATMLQRFCENILSK